MPGKRAEKDEKDNGWLQIIGEGEVSGHPVIYYPKIDSTNDRCMEIGLAGGQPGTVVIAEYQTGGKGRLYPAVLS